MGIPVSKLHEGCCDTSLSSFTIIDGDALDSAGSTCDKIIDCNDKYYLIEEKSIVFAFFNNCCIENGVSLDNTYKYTQSGVEYLKISEIITNVIQPLDIEIKKRILSETVTELISTSAKKASNTTHLLAKDFDISKTKDMPVFYLYCKSGEQVDRVLSGLLSRYRKLKFIECQKLKSKLNEECK